jgi:nucleotide-binding universal stress UspA family protein
MSEHPVIACYRGLDSADAVGIGAMLAAALEQPLVLASAYRYEPAALSARALPASENELRAEAAAEALRRARRFAGSDVDLREAVVPSASIIDALVDLAQASDACALVLGRDTQGHVTRSLIPHAPCAVAVAPLSVPLPSPGPPRRIGVAFDDSPAARCALVAAARLALATQAQLELFAAGPSSERAAGLLDTGRGSLEASRVDLRASALVGDPATCLTEATRDLDLLVCGSRGRSRPLSMILGSVSIQLVSRAHCPVLVVPSRVARSDRSPLGISSAATNA